MYYNYHAKAKQLISDGHLVEFKILPRWNSIAPALVLYFDNHKPMPNVINNIARITIPPAIPV